MYSEEQRRPLSDSTDAQSDIGLDFTVRCTSFCNLPLRLLKYPRHYIYYCYYLFSFFSQFFFFFFLGGGGEGGGE